MDGVFASLWARSAPDDSNSDVRVLIALLHKNVGQQEVIVFAKFDSCSIGLICLVCIFHRMRTSATRCS